MSMPPTRDAQRAKNVTDPTPLVVALAALDRGSLVVAGGKAANLGELIQARFPVPSGFCVTTAAYALAAEDARLGPILETLDNASSGDMARLEAVAAQARAALLATPAPDAVARALGAAYQEWMSADAANEAPAVAVRSSATAEDLPFASFAGQQDTFLNVVGEAAVLDMVRRCWASLWTGRAVAYRASNGIDQRTVRLAVVVQRMIAATASGVLFTANPLTGRRRQQVIDASLGLGEAVVSGAVNPDHYVVTAPTGPTAPSESTNVIVERRLGDKRLAIRPMTGGGTAREELSDHSAVAALTDAQIEALSALGARVEAHYGAPQDIEWALDAAGQLWLTQARPITTLYPLPANAPTSDERLRVYFSVNVAQGVLQPLTPMGVQAFRLLGSGVATIFGHPPRDPCVGPATLVEAGQRLFIDLTPVARSALGRRLARRVLGAMEARAAAIFQRLASDPRLSLAPTPRGYLVRAALRALVQTRMPLRMLRAFLRPGSARAKVARVRERILERTRLSLTARAAVQLDGVERVLLTFPRLMPRVFAIALTGLLANMLAGRLLRGLATSDERQAVLRGLPNNVTTEMSLALWTLAQQMRADVESARALRGCSPEFLAHAYQAQSLPVALQAGLADFLQMYGHRAIAEIDLGVPRWSEDPSHILGVLANYLQLDDPDQAPDLQFRRAAAGAEAMLTELARRARRHGRLRGALVGLLLGRTRALLGWREEPKFVAVLLLAQARALLRHVGSELASAGRIDAADDIFFLTLPEARAALAGADLRQDVAARRASYAHEMARRHVPRVLLSDGTEPTGDLPISIAGVAGAEALYGAPASAGSVTATARVILDPTGARLEPGEILVAPSTDPGWTPLFLTAAGLVMEMGGAMSHGAVVAREYGIPAVVGVPDATTRIVTGQRITIDGATGVVMVVEPSNSQPLP